MRRHLLLFCSLLLLCALVPAQQVIRRPIVTGGCSVTATWTDNFNDGVIDTTCLWDNFAAGPDGAFISVTETTTLNMITSGGTFTGTTEEGLVTKDFRDFTGKRFRIQRTAHNANYNEQIIVLNGSDYFLIAFNASTGNIEAVTSNGGFLGNCTTDNFWSIRHDTGTDHIIFETSADGSSWTPCSGGDVARVFAITSMKQRVEIYGLAGYNAIATISWDDASVQ